MNKNKLKEIAENTHLVTITEHDRFSGPKLLEKKLFSSKKEAEEFCREHNAGNTEAVAPDYYVVAHYQGTLL